MIAEPIALDPPVQYVTVNGIRLAYRESGTVGNPVMILLHGIAETSAFFWRPLIRYFERNYHIIAFDLPGHGDSDESHIGYDMDQQGWLIAQAAQKLGAVPAVYIGHSFGGIIATHIAIHWPDLADHLVLYDTPLPDSVRNNILRFVRNMPLKAVLMTGPLVIPFLARIFVRSVPIRLTLRFVLLSWRVPYHRDRLNNEFLDQASRHSGNALFEMTQTIFLGRNIIEQLQNLSVPTCIVIGDSDIIVPRAEAEQWAHMIPNARLTVLPNAGHVSLLDNPDEFNNTVDNFLRTS